MAVNIKNNAPNVTQVIEAGVIPGFVRYKKFGRAPSISNGQWGTVWDGSVDYPYPTVNLVSPSIVSTDVSDDQDIVIEAINDQFKFVKQTVSLNGTTPVNLPKDIMIPFRMENVSADSLLGEVTLVSNAVTYAYIKNSGNEYNQSQMAIMAIPVGYYGLVTKVGFTFAGTNAGEVNYRAKPFGQAWKTKRPLDLNQPLVEQVDFFFDEKSLIDVRAKPSTANSAASAWFDLILVEKEVFHRIWGDPKRFSLKE